VDGRPSPAMTIEVILTVNINGGGDNTAFQKAQ
jgi:hypothetical protein